MPDIKINLTLGKSIITNLALSNRLIAAASQRRAPSLDDREKAEASYPLTVFHRHLTTWQPLRGNLLGADVLEVGPGSHSGLSLLALLAGARSASCLDVAPHAQEDDQQALAADLVKTAATYPDTYLIDPALLERATADPAALARDLLARVTYHAPMDITHTTLPDASLDVICSHICFEHVADPELAVAEIARLLRPGGVTSHQIDLRDHRDFNHPLEFLAYNETLWRLATSHRPNAVRTRWRASHYRAAFERHGLEIMYLEVVYKTEVTEQMRRRFARPFQRLSLEDLGILSLLLVARKRASAPPARSGYRTRGR